MSEISGILGAIISNNGNGELKSTRTFETEAEALEQMKRICALRPGDTVRILHPETKEVQTGVFMQLEQNSCRVCVSTYNKDKQLDGWTLTPSTIIFNDAPEA